MSGGEGVGESTLTLSLHYRWLLLAILCFAHGLPLLAILPGAVPTWARTLVLTGVIASGMWHWWGARGRYNVYLDLLTSGEAQLRARGATIPVDVVAPSLDLGWLIVVCWQDLSSEREGRVVVTREAFSKTEWRALKVWLRWRACTASGSSSRT